MFVLKIAFPSIRIFSTHPIESTLLEKGALKEESANVKETPISAYLIAKESFAPSPIIATTLF